MEEHPAVRVTIFGNEYTIRGEADADYIAKLAQYVDGKMQEIARSANLAIPLKVSILAAINLADEIFRLRAQAASTAPETPGPAPEAIQALAKHIQEALREEGS